VIKSVRPSTANRRKGKRGIVGTFHDASKRYPHLYLAKFQFRHNSRFNDDISDRR
jgi:hypothetical protein